MRFCISLLILLTFLVPMPAGAGPEGQMTLVFNVSTAARWFDPAESEGLITNDPLDVSPDQPPRGRSKSPLGSEAR